MTDDWTRIDEARRRWEADLLRETLEKTPESRPRFDTTSGREVQRLYTPAADAISGYLDRLGFPGEYPFTRGIHPTMYRGRLWTMRQYAGYGTAEESNRRFKYLLDQGTTGLSVAFDLPTQIGYDSDHPMAAGEVGRVGVAIDTLADMETLFAGIPLDRVSTSMTINATAAVLMAMYVAVAEKQGVRPDQLEGTVQNDILKEYVARGTYIFPPRPSIRLVSDLMAYCADEIPRWNAISVSGYHIREAGATASQEIGFTLANAISYIEAALAAGLHVDDFAPRMAFFFGAHTDLFEEVAKFRAARRLYARLMRERFGAAKPRSWMLRFHTQTGGVTLTAQEPNNNIVRVTIQALAAVLGGTQSLHTNSRDEALALPTEESVRIALRTQQIIAHESGVANTVDPLGGSYFVERLTDEIESEAAGCIDTIDRLGGAVAAIEQGYIQREIEASAYAAGQAMESGERVVVGVNRFVTDEPARLELLRIDPEVSRRQIEKLATVKHRRDNAKVHSALAEIDRAARSTDNLLPPILEAVRAYASVGEICDVLRAVFGEYEEGWNA